MPTTAVCRPSPNGGFKGVPSTKCRSGTGMGSGRPGSASSGAIMRVFEPNRNMPYGPLRTRFVTRRCALLVPVFPGDGVQQLQRGGLRGGHEHLAAEVLELREE